MNPPVALHWINGAWIDSVTHATSINPATYETIGQYADGGPVEAQAAIDVAFKVFNESGWRDDRALRARVLDEMAAAFERHTPDLIELLSLENGKVRGEAAFEVTMVPSKLRYYAALTRTEHGRSGTPTPYSMSVVLREPMGVAGIITPWNSPVVLMIRSLAPALAAGCTVVVKLPGQTAQTNAKVSQILSEVPSLPAGVINIFSESVGRGGSRLMVESPHVPVISFTGSSATGRAISATGAKTLKRFGLELGGKTPHLLFADADLAVALPKIEKSLTIFAGQFCMTGSRLLVQREIADEVRSALSARLEEVRVGPGTEPGSDMGPLIDKENVERVNGLVEAAIAQGAKVLVRGGPVREGELAKGAFYRPTLLEVTDPTMPIVQDETFGPVLTLQVFDTEAEAIALANDSQYGLAAAIWTRDIDRPFRLGRKIAAGTIWINDWAVVYDDFEEGGFKQSGLGRLNGMAAIDDFIEYKHITWTHGG
jgi:betaine-aldehyde dehydrogenase